MENKKLCPVCEEHQSRCAQNSKGIIQIECPRCQIFRLTEEAWDEIQVRKLSGLQKAKLSGWIFEQHQIGSIPLLDEKFVTNVDKINLPSINERCLKLLEQGMKIAPKFGSSFNFNEPLLKAATYSETQQDFNLIGTILKNEGWVALAGKGNFQITSKGFLRFEEIGRKILSRIQGFVAMSFKPRQEMDTLFDKGLRLGIEEAGYKALRVDKENHINKIDDEVISQIKRSKFLVADYTGQNNGVYYEAGYAAGLGIPVISCCKEDDHKNLHFDIRQYNCILWKNSEDLAKQLQLRIESVLGDGPNKKY